MWKPAQRIKYLPSEGQWPTEAQAKTSQLFSSISYQALSLRTRTWVPAMVPWRATENGEVTPEVIDWYRRFAKGKPGALVVEATGIRDIPSGPLLRIGHDRYIDGLRQIVTAVNEASEGVTKLYIQLIDFLNLRKRVEKEKYIHQFLQIKAVNRQALGLSDVTSDDEIKTILLTLDDQELQDVLEPQEFETLMQGQRDRVTDTHKQEIEELPVVLPALFANAAERAKIAGFDGAELHYAHAYTMASFLSATNTRADQYGNSLQNRLRLPLEVYQAVRAQVSDNFVVGCRILSDECIEGGSTVTDASFFACAFAKAGMDFISLSRGGKFDDAKQPKPGWTVYPYTGPSGYECMPQYISDEFGPFGRNIEPVATINRAVKAQGKDTPIIVTGGFHNFTQAETALQNNQADIIGFARQAMADPDWFTKVPAGAGAQVRLCKYTNYCEGLDQKHKQVTCNLWDRFDLEHAEFISTDGRRRLTAPEWIPTKTIT